MVASSLRFCDDDSKTSGSWSETSSGPDSAALDRAKMRTTSAASQAHSYRWRRPRARGTAAIGAKCLEMSA